MKIGSTRILIVEDDQQRRLWFEARFAGYQCDVTDQVSIAISWLKERDYDLIFLDHDLTEEHYYEALADDGLTGYVVAVWLAQNPDRQAPAQIIVHSLNHAGSARMIEVLHTAGRKAEHLPFPYLSSLF